MSGLQSDRPHQAAKTALRDAVRERIATIPPHRRVRSDERIHASLLRVWRIFQPSYVVGYLALRDEAPVETFLCCIIELGGQVLLPRVVGTGLEFGRWWPCQPLARDRANVLAPSGRAVRMPAGAGLLLVPGRAFDEEGRRLGRGRGYYDAVLAGLEEGVATVGVAYEEQLVERVPADSFDRSVSVVVTQDRVVSVAERVPAQRLEGRMHGRGAEGSDDQEH